MHEEGRRCRRQLDPRPPAAALRADGGGHTDAAGAGAAVPCAPRYWPYGTTDHTAEGDPLDATRPAFSFTCLIGLAVLNAGPEAQLSVGQIYDYIQRNFPFFQTAKGTWKNSVRHVLSLNKFFERRRPTAPAPASAKGQGAAAAGAVPGKSSSAAAAAAENGSRLAAAHGTGGKGGVWAVKPGMQLLLLEHITEGQQNLSAATARHLGLPELPDRYQKELAAAAARSKAGSSGEPLSLSATSAAMITGITPPPPPLSTASTNRRQAKKAPPPPLIIKQEMLFDGAAGLPPTPEHGVTTPTRRSKASAASTASSPAKMPRRTSAGKAKQRKNSTAKGKRRTSSTSTSARTATNAGTVSTTPASAGKGKGKGGKGKGGGKGKVKIKAEPYWTHPSASDASPPLLEATRHEGYPDAATSYDDDDHHHQSFQGSRNADVCMVADVDMGMSTTHNQPDSKGGLHHKVLLQAVAPGRRFNLLPVAGCETEEEEGMQLGDIVNDSRPLSTGSGGSSGTNSVHTGEGYCGEEVFLSPYDMSSGMSMLYDTTVGSELAAVAAASNGAADGGWGALVGVA